MKKIYLLLVFCFAVSVSYAQVPVAGSIEETVTEEPVGNRPMTLNVSYFTGVASIANHYLSANEYSNISSGFHVDLGRFYKRWENVSWNLSYDYCSSLDRAGGLENSAKTSSMSYTAMSLNYSSFYNWMFGKGLLVKVGGGLDISGDLISNLTHAMNNAVSLNILAQLEASAGISYIFKFKKWMLGLYGNLSTPFAGLILADAKHEPAAALFSSDLLMKNYFSHLKGTSFSNLQGVDVDFGIKFITPRVAIDLGLVSENRWWYVNDIQNRRMHMMFQLGASFNLVSLKQTKTIHRYF